MYSLGVLVQRELEWQMVVAIPKLMKKVDWTWGTNPPWDFTHWAKIEGKDAPSPGQRNPSTLELTGAQVASQQSPILLQAAVIVPFPIG